MPSRLLSSAFVIYLTFANGVGAQTPLGSTVTPPKPSLPVATQIKKTVGFIQTECRHTETEEEKANSKKTGIPTRASDSYSGTGFFVGIRDKRIADGGGSAT